ncbi:MAG: type IX secretion system protein PorQ [Fluviicola sp.]
MKTKLLLAACLLWSTSGTFAQTGGNNAFAFLDLTYNARQMGLANDFISVMDADINIGVANPAMLNPEMHNMLSVNQALMPGGINVGMGSYGFGFRDRGTMSGFVKYVSYGTFQRTSANGTAEGTFSPVEMIAGAGYGQQLNERLSVGANLYAIFSSLENYSSFGAAIDLAGTYYDKEKGFAATALVKNAGVQFNAYTQNSTRAPLPVEFQMAASYKLAHAPFRFSILAHHLNQWDITYNDPNLQPTVDALTGDTIPVPRANFAEKLGRHFTYQVETIISQNIHIRLGFDYHRRRELALSQRPGAAGFSLGLGLYFNKFRLDYGFLINSRAGFNNMITFSTQLDKWRK